MRNVQEEAATSIAIFLCKRGSRHYRESAVLHWELRCSFCATQQVEQSQVPSRDLR